ncbi:MAG: peptide ABC transporter substrate-binding protein [Bdellovibrionota bacterium]
MTSRRVALLKCILCLLLVCVSAQVQAAADAFRFRMQIEPLTLDWTYAHTNYETYVLMNIMEGLVEINETLQPSPALAEKWETSDDGLTYVFHLKKGVKWTDGAPLKTEHFIYSWKRLLAPKNTNEYASFLFDIENAEAYHKGKIKRFEDVGIKALDERRIQVKLRRVVPYFVTLLSFWVTFPQRKDLIEKHQGNWILPENLVTLGPYRIQSWSRGKEIVFERNPTYHAAQSAVPKIVAVIEPSDERARELLEQKKIDALLGVSTQDIVRYTAESTASWRLKQSAYLALVYIAFNARKEPSSKAVFRKAIAHAINRAQIPTALQGGETPADSLVPRGIAGYDPNAGLQYLPHQAIELLKQSGIKDRLKKDRPLVLLTRKGRLEDIAKYLQESLRQTLQLNIQVQALEPSAFEKALAKGHHDMYIRQWGADYPDASSFMEVFLSDRNTNATGWKNSQYDALVKNAGGSVKVLDRLQYYTDAQRVLLQEHAIVAPLYYPKLTALVSTDVSAFEISPLNYFFFRRIRMK